MNIRAMGKVKEAGEFAFSLWHFGRAIGAIVIGISMIMCMGLLDEEYEGMTERAYAIITSVDTPAVEMKYEFEGEEYQVRTLVKDTSDFDEGDKVRIRFNEDQPEVAVLVGSEQYNVYSILSKVFMVVGGIFIIVGVVRIIPSIRFFVSKLKDTVHTDYEDE